MRPFFAPCPSGGDDADSFAAPRVDDCKADALVRSDGNDALFPKMVWARDLDDWAVPDAFRLVEIDPVFFDVLAFFVFIPLKLYYLSVARYVYTLRSTVLC